MEEVNISSDFLEQVFVQNFFFFIDVSPLHIDPRAMCLVISHQLRKHSRIESNFMPDSSTGEE